MNSTMTVVACMAAALALGAGQAPGATTRPVDSAAGTATRPATMRPAPIPSDSTPRSPVLPVVTEPGNVPEASELAVLVERLNADDFATREAATKRLEELPGAALSAVEKAFAAKPLPPEAEVRAGAIVKFLEAKPGQVLVFQFADTPAEQMLELMERRYHVAIVQPEEIDVRITMKSDQALGMEDAIELLDKALTQRGYSARLITTPEGPAVLRVMTQEEAKGKQVPVHVGADPATIALNDDVITQVIPLVTCSAEQLRKDLLPLLSQDAQIATTHPNSLVITDTSAKINRLVQIIQKLDQPKRVQRDGGTGRVYTDGHARTSTIILNGPPQPQQEVRIDRTVLNPMDH